MKCIETKGYVDAYINHALSERQQEEFIRHVKTCPDCFQELETYFIVDVALKHFDDKKWSTYDISNLLQEDLDKRFRKRQQKKFMVIAVIILAVIFVLFVARLMLQWFI